MVSPADDQQSSVLAAEAVPTDADLPSTDAEADSLVTVEEAPADAAPAADLTQPDEETSASAQADEIAAEPTQNGDGVAAEVTEPEPTSDDTTLGGPDAAAGLVITPFADVAGPGPTARDVSQERFRAARGATYSNTDLAAADSSDVVTQLTSSDRVFQCGDTLVFFEIIPVVGSAEGESTATVTQVFDTRFGNNDQVGYTDVTAFLAFQDSGYSSDGEEAITGGTGVSGTWSDGTITLTTTVDDIEAGETIVIEYWVSLTCDNPPGTISGNIHASHSSTVISQNGGDGPSRSTGGGNQTVPLFANAVQITALPESPEITEAVCVDGGVTAPTLRLPADGAAVSYAVDADGPYVAGQSVKVRATLADGFGWGELPEGWEQISATTAKLVVTFAQVKCIPVVPETPEITEAVCVDGGVTAPTLRLPADGAAVSYAVDADGPYVAGQSVKVRATLADGFAWGELPEGWEKASATTAKLVVTFAQVKCIPVVPETPEITQAVCGDGAVTATTLTPLVDSAAVSYTVDGAGQLAADGSVIVTATLADGFAWGELPEGWVETSPTTAELVVTFAEVECVPVVPEAPEVTQAVCVDGGVTAPTLTLPADTTGVTHTVDADGPYVSGGSVTVTVTVTLADGFAWGELPEGWEQTSAMAAQLVVTFADVECTPVAPQPLVVTEADCVDGELTAPTVALPRTEGLGYSISPEGPYVAGQTVTATAALADGYEWGALPAGWTTHSPTATFEVELGEGGCPSSSAALPETGVSSAQTLGSAAAVALGLGIALLAVARRRRVNG